MDTNQSVENQQDARKGNQHLNVQVVTTSGTYPEDGPDSVPVHQPVKVMLEKAQKKLEIADTTGWIVTAGGTAVDANKSYADNDLHGSVKLDWGPKEGGGGKGGAADA